VLDEDRPTDIGLDDKSLCSPQLFCQKQQKGSQARECGQVTITSPTRRLPVMCLVLGCSFLERLSDAASSVVCNGSLAYALQDLFKRAILEVELDFLRFG